LKGKGRTEEKKEKPIPENLSKSGGGKLLGHAPPGKGGPKTSIVQHITKQEKQKEGLRKRRGKKQPFNNFNPKRVKREHTAVSALTKESKKEEARKIRSPRRVAGEYLVKEPRSRNQSFSAIPGGAGTGNYHYISRRQ